MLDLAEIREILVEPDLAKLTLVGTVMDAEPPSVPLGASLVDALRVFESSGAWVLPVLDGEEYVGLLSKSRLFDRYRAELSAQTDD
jgi:CIC family chloride channel protein